MMIGLYLLLNFLVLWVVARASSARGWRLILMLFLLGFVVGSANNLIEAMFFGVLPPREVAAAAVPAAIIFVILAPVAGLFAGRWKSAGVAVLEAGGFTPLTLLAVVIAYELLYWTSGILVYPYIADFYATRTIPPAYLVAAVQIPRSLIFIGAVYPLLKSGLRGGPLVLALVYGVIMVLTIIFMPFGTARSTPARTIAPAASAKPRVRTSERTGPIWRGGKLTTASTCRPTRTSGL